MEPSESPTLETLPEEILLEILKSLADGAHDEDRVELYSPLCLVKPLAPAATELLYEKIVITKYHPRPQLLLRTLLHRPALGEMVRMLELRGRADNKKPILDTEAIEQYIAAARTQEQIHQKISLMLKDLGYYTYIYQDCLEQQQEYLWAVVLSLLLLHLPKLTSLEIFHLSPPPYALQLNLGDFLFEPRENDVTSRLDVACSNLKSVTILSCNLSLETLAGLFRMSTLKHVSIESGSLCETEARLFKHVFHCLEEGTFSIETLRYRSSDLSTNTVAKLITCCKSLKRLSYCQGYEVTDATSTLDLSVIHSALFRHRDTLHTLELIGLSEFSYPTPNWSCFEALKWFHMDMESFFEQDHRFDITDRLPPNVERLGFNCIKNNLLRHIFSVADSDDVDCAKVLNGLSFDY